MKRFIFRFLKIHPGEGAKTLVMFMYLLSVVSAFITGRIAQATFFLKRYDVSILPYMYVFVAICVSISAILYSKVFHKFRRDRLIISYKLIMALCVIISAILMENKVTIIYPIFYVLVEILGALSIIQFWTLANDIHTFREAKRLFGVIGAGGVCANIVCGFFIRPLVKIYGPEMLLWSCVFFLLLSICFVVILGRGPKNIFDQVTSGMESKQKKSWANPKTIFFEGKFSSHLRLIAALVTITFISTTFIDYNYKIELKSLGEAEMAVFQGDFYFWTGVISCFIQFFLTARLMEFFGISVCLLLLPLFLSFGYFGFLSGFLGMFWGMVYAKGAENCLRYTVFDSTSQLLYLPVTSKARSSAKTLIDGVIKPISIGLSGLFLAVILKFWGTKGTIYVTVFLILVWLLVIFLISRQYLKTLMSTLKQRRLNFNESTFVVRDEATFKVISNYLNKDQKYEDIVHALELIPSVSGYNFREKLLDLLWYDSKDVLILTMEQLKNYGVEGDVENLFPLLNNEDPEIKAKAIGLYCHLKKDQALDYLERFLDHRHLQVRAATLQAMIQYGGLEGMILAAQPLQYLIQSDLAEERIWGIYVIEELGVKAFARQLEPLLRDPDAEVRRAAVSAAGLLTHERLFDPLLEKLCDLRVAPLAIKGLAAYGSEVIPKLEELILNQKKNFRIRKRIPMVLSRINFEESALVLIGNLTKVERTMRTEMMSSLRRLLGGNHFQIKNLEGILSDYIQFEKDQAIELFKPYSLIDAKGDSLLRETVRMELEACIDRILYSFDVLFPESQIAMLVSNLRSQNPNVRANAIEVLVSVIPKWGANIVLPYLEKQPIENTFEKLEINSNNFSYNLDPYLKNFLNDENPMMVSATIHFIAEENLAKFTGALLRACSDERYLIRETALYSLLKMDKRSEINNVISDLINDEVAIVRDYAKFVQGKLLDANYN